MGDAGEGQHRGGRFAPARRGREIEGGHCRHFTTIAYIPNGHLAGPSAGRAGSADASPLTVVMVAMTIVTMMVVMMTMMEMMRTDENDDKR